MIIYSTSLHYSTKCCCRFWVQHLFGIMSEDTLYYNQVACAEDFVAVAKYLENGGIPMDFDTYVEHFGYGLSDEDVTAEKCCDMLDDNTDQDFVSFSDSVLLDSTETDLLCQSLM